MSDDTRPTIVIPCYNEEQRLSPDRFVSMVKGDRIRLLFVDDGSTDRTATVLDRLANRSSSISVMKLSVNSGKGEAVRHGLLSALGLGAAIVGYYDADLATPPTELLRLVAIMQDQPGLSAVLGARVARLGTSIQRAPLRHYAGRAYASLASWILGVPVYDTQCGAKLFRATPALVAAVQDPFPSRWSFDVHLIDRLLRGTRSAPALAAETFLEEPLREWRDVMGSKMKPTTALGAYLDLGLFGLQRAISTSRSASTITHSASTPAEVWEITSRHPIPEVIYGSSGTEGDDDTLEPITISPFDAGARRRERKREGVRLDRELEWRANPAAAGARRPA